MNRKLKRLAAELDSVPAERVVEYFDRFGMAQLPYDELRVVVGVRVVTGTASALGGTYATQSQQSRRVEGLINGAVCGSWGNINAKVLPEVRRMCERYNAAKVQQCAR